MSDTFAYHNELEQVYHIDMKYELMIIVSLAIAGAVSAQEPRAHTLGEPDRPVLRYNAQHVRSPVPDAPWYGRSGFIHPVYTPAGRVVTDDFPEDHRHQHGLMFAWTSARIDGRKADFWNSHRKQAKIEHVETVEADANTIVVKLRHIDLTGDKPTAVIEETWRIVRVAHERFNVFDLESVQTCIRKKPIVIAKYKYGGMCIRGAGDWIGGSVNMLTSEGKSQETGNHTRPQWVAMFGKVDGTMCGIAAIAHPTNHHAPQPVRLHPKMPYFCYAPMVAGEFKLEPNKPFVSRFRFVAFDGEPDAEALTTLRNAFVKP